MTESRTNSKPSIPFVLLAIAKGLAIAAAAACIAHLSVLLAPDIGRGLPVGPAAGIALAAGWRFGRPWVLPAGLGVAAAAVMPASGAQATEALFAFASTIAGPTAALFLIQALARRHPRADRFSSMTRFVLASCLVAAPIDVLFVAIGALSSGAAFATLNVRPLLAWGLLDALWMVLLTPAALALVDVGNRAERRLRPDWPTLLIALALVAGDAAFASTGRQGLGPLMLTAFLPLAAWNAARTLERSNAITLFATAACLVVGLVIRDGAAVLTADALVVLLSGGAVGLLMQAIATDRTQALARIASQAYEDPLTGLLSDRGLRAELASRVASVSRPNYALIGLQISNLDAIQALGGPDEANGLEVSIASMLMRLRPAANASRIAPGRFAVLFSADTVQQVRGAARELYGQLNGRMPAMVPSGVQVSTSVGGLLIGGQTRVRVDDCLLALAETLAIAASARDPQLFVEPLQEAAIEARRSRQQRLEEVRRAIREERLAIHAEPMDDPRAPSGSFTFEILTRIHGQDDTLIMPQQFLPIASESRLTVGLDRGVIRKVFSWFAEHPGPLSRTHRCSINLSGPTMSDPGTAAYIREQRACFGIPAEKIVFEITEGEAIRNATAARLLLDELRADGFGIALDDFGTGLSSFDYLKRFPVDYLKIDGAFVRNLLETPIDEEIVLAVVRVARRLGVRTTAEHVRDEATRTRLRALGIDIMQGELIGRPVPIDRLFERRSRPISAADPRAGAPSQDAGRRAEVVKRSIAGGRRADRAAGHSPLEEKVSARSRSR